MTSRERLRYALGHRQQAWVPIDFGGHRSSCISAISYARLKKALGVFSGNIYVYDMVQQLAVVEPDVLDAIGTDVVELGRGFMLDDADWKVWELPDGTPCKIPGYINVHNRGQAYTFNKMSIYR